MGQMVQLTFKEDDWMEIREMGGVIVLNSIIFNCDTTVTSTAAPISSVPSPSSAPSPAQQEDINMEEAKEKWGHAYSQHQKDSFKLKRKQEMYDHFAKLKN